MLDKIYVTLEESGLIKLTGIVLSRKERIIVQKINQIVDLINEG